MTTPADQPPSTNGTQKAVIDKNLQKVLEHFAKLKKEAYEKRTVNDAVPWLRPKISEGAQEPNGPQGPQGLQDSEGSQSSEGWKGSLQTEKDIIEIHQAFQTDEAEDKLIKAYTPGDAGNVGDGVVLPLQIDYMMQAERAYRARVTQSFPRAVAHVASRENGHGQSNGVFLGQTLKYFTTLLKQGAN